MEKFEDVLMSSLIEGPYLKHYGILGMKWGIRRFQPYRLIPRLSGKRGKEVGEAKTAAKRYSNNSKSSSSRSVSKSRKQKSVEAKQQYEEEAKTARQRTAVKEKAIKSGSATEVFSNRTTMSNKELKEAIERIDMEKKIRELYAAEHPTKLQKFNKFMGKVDDTKQGLEKGVNAYNTVAKIHNTFSDKELPIIGEKGKGLKAAQKTIADVSKEKNKLKADYDKVQKQLDTYKEQERTKKAEEKVKKDLSKKMDELTAENETLRNELEELKKKENN